MFDFFQKIAVSSLLLFSTVLHVHSTPLVNSPDWKIAQTWHDENGKAILVAKSSSLPEMCRSLPDSYIQFPPVFLSTHVISLDGKVISTFGDENSLRSFYGSPFVSCRSLVEGHEVEWKVAATVHYFAHFSEFPTMVDQKPASNLVMETLNVMAAASLLVMAIFCGIVFFGKIPLNMNMYFSLAQLFLAGYFISTVPEFFSWNSSALTIHRCSDICLWLGACCLFNTFRLDGLVNWKFYGPLIAISAFASLFILFGNNGDVVQFGTTLPFGVVLFGLILAMGKLIRESRKDGWQKGAFLKLLSLGFFSASAFNDVFITVGLMSGPMVFAAGIVGTIIFFALSVNDQIMAAYRERDHLRSNLEDEVDKKTRELTAKTHLLENTMGELKNTQAELIQSAKLASLGTLSAGIAHEINNSLNYVNGALRPLEKIIASKIPPEESRKVNVLLKGMHEGLALTFEIIKSLRSYTGLNQAKFNDIGLKNIIDSVLVMVRNKLSEKTVVTVTVDPDLKIFGHVVGLNQVFMNLIVNAIDAMPAGGELKISADTLENDVRLSISDTGHGIPKEVVERIFEPFFTTKEVGKGTGLGLYLVKKEIERHHGEISVESKPGNGTIFSITLPRNSPIELKEVA